MDKTCQTRLKRVHSANVALVGGRDTVAPKQIGRRPRGGNEARVLVVLVTLLERLKDAVPHVRLSLMNIPHNHNTLIALSRSG